jgi:hypothetical protein
MNERETRGDDDNVRKPVEHNYIPFSLGNYRTIPPVLAEYCLSLEGDKKKPKRYCIK